MHPRTAFRISLAAGLLVLAVTLMWEMNSPPRPCGNLPQNYQPIIAFELARSAADLEAIFGTSEPCRSAMVERMDAVNLMDVLVYIPAYGAFMAFFFLGMRGRDVSLGTLGFRVSLVAIVGDYAENVCLMSLTPEVDPTSMWFALLPWATGVKWLALGAAAAVAAMIYMRAAGARALNTCAGLVCAVAALSTVAAMAMPAKFGPLVGLGVALSWLIYLFTAAAAAWRPVAGTVPTQAS